LYAGVFFKISFTTPKSKKAAETGRTKKRNYAANLKVKKRGNIALPEIIHLRWKPKRLWALNGVLSSKCQKLFAEDKPAGFVSRRPAALRTPMIKTEPRDCWFAGGD